MDRPSQGPRIGRSMIQVGVRPEAERIPRRSPNCIGLFYQTSQSKHLEGCNALRAPPDVQHVRYDRPTQLPDLLPHSFGLPPDERVVHRRRWARQCIDPLKGVQNDFAGRSVSVPASPPRSVAVRRRERRAVEGEVLGRSASAVSPGARRRGR